MTIKLNRALFALGVAAALAAPSAALAHDGASSSGSGSDNQPQAEADHGVAGATGVVGPAPISSSERSGRSPSHLENGGRGGDTNRSGRIDLRGLVVSVDPTAQTIVVSVSKANPGRRGRIHVAQTITFDVSSARLDVRDVNGDGTRNLNDVTAGDSVEVRAELRHSGPSSLTGPVVAQRLKDRTDGHADHQAQQPSDTPNHG